MQKQTSSKGTDAIWLQRNPLMESNTTTTKTLTGEMDDEMKEVKNLFRSPVATNSEGCMSASR